jgi:hypothetical protein
VVLKLLSDHRVRMVFWAVLILASVVLASCGNDGGMHQGGGDSEPHWR